MEALLSAVASDIVGRLISFLISKLQQPSSTDDDVGRLQRALLRARVVVEDSRRPRCGRSPTGRCCCSSAD
jgi:hypothetical protein